MLPSRYHCFTGSDQTYVAKLLVTHKDNPYFSNVLKNPNDFVIRHYAGDVHYEVPVRACRM